MRRTIFFLTVLVCAFSAVGQTRERKQTGGMRAAVAALAAKTTTSTLPIRRVILYSNGVSYIERRGIVTGNAEINLAFKQSQVDDVLKSMVVLDLGQGKIGAVSYNSSAPISSRMAEIPFSVDAISADGGISAVLAQLQGAKVVVTSTRGVASGSILTIERKQTKSEKETKVNSVLVIASESGEISSFDLADVKSVKLIEDGTRRDVNEFANATASARRLDAKTITVTSEGAGQREMVVTYTIAAPIWKTTYRVVLDNEGKPFFQGWAIVDNVSEEDWEGVQMSLVSGSPISFIQNLQKPFYRYRPVVPTPEDLQLEPQVYEPGGGVGYGSGSGAGSNDSDSDSISGKVVDPNGAVVAGARVTITNAVTGRAYSTTTDSDGDFEQDGLARGQYNVRVDSSGFKSMIVTGANTGRELQVRLEVGSVSELVTVTAGQISQLPVNGGRSGANFMMASPGSVVNSSFNPNETKVSDALTGANSGVTAAATGAEIGDLFEYRIEQPVTVNRNRSALIPIVQTKMDGERVAVYNESVRLDRPFSGVLLKNTTNLTLESGSLTVIDGNAYAGEALMERLKPKEQRLISFALDLGTNVVVRNDGNREPAKLIKAVNGVFQVHYFQGEQKTYEIANQTERKKTVYIEYPVRSGWELSDESPKPDYTTQRYYRFRVELGAFENKKLKIAVRQPLMDSYQLTSLQKTDLALFVTRGYISEAVRTQLEKLIDIRTQIAEIERKLESFGEEVEKIEADQKRLRQNIEALAKTPEAKTLIARYIAKAGEQETRLEDMEKERKTLAAQREQLAQQQAAEIRNFEIK
ncbi:MAG: carboxypeptidase regulatory-like domain-containing protein [Pyrinomonadaceae bacterium]